MSGLANLVMRRGALVPRSSTRVPFGSCPPCLDRRTLWFRLRSTLPTREYRARARALGKLLASWGQFRLRCLIRLLC
jgi:hypothetical protein